MDPAEQGEQGKQDEQEAPGAAITKVVQDVTPEPEPIQVTQEVGLGDRCRFCRRDVPKQSLRDHFGKGLFVCFHTTSLSGRWFTALKQFLPRHELLKQGYF